MMYHYTMPQKTIAVKPNTLLQLKRIQLEMTGARDEATRVTMDEVILTLIDNYERSPE